MAPTRPLGSQTPPPRRLRGTSQARVVKTLDQVGAEVMLNTSGFAHPPAMFMAGDDEDAKRAVSTLLARLSFKPVHSAGL
jgi:8-hydroxy-5-deazaflavin:NADPH oxidoreductase